jgi:hypothetical protein
MTTPRDDIAGLSERLREPHVAFARKTDCTDLGVFVRWLKANCREAATQLDSLLKERDARVKELEADFLAVSKWHSQAVEENEEIQDRALRAEQERDEAYERAAGVAKERAVKLRAKAKSLKRPHNQHYFAQAIEASVIESAIVRRLAGPEKEKKE